MMERTRSLKLTLWERIRLYRRLRPRHFGLMLVASAGAVAGLLTLGIVLIIKLVQHCRAGDDAKVDPDVDAALRPFRDQLANETDQLEAIFAATNLAACSGELQALGKLVIQERCQYGPDVMHRVSALYQCALTFSSASASTSLSVVREEVQQLLRQMEPWAKALRDLAIKQLSLPPPIDGADNAQKLRARMAASLPLAHELAALGHGCDLHRQWTDARQALPPTTAPALLDHATALARHCTSSSLSRFVRQFVHPPPAPLSAAMPVLDEHAKWPVSLHGALVPIAEDLVQVYKCSLKGLRLFLKAFFGSAAHNGHEHDRDSADADEDSIKNVEMMRNREQRTRLKLFRTVRLQHFLLLQGILRTMGDRPTMGPPLKPLLEALMARPMFAALRALLDDANSSATLDLATRRDVCRVYADFALKRYMFHDSLYQWGLFLYCKNNGKLDADARAAGEEEYRQETGNSLWLQRQHLFYHDLEPANALRALYDNMPAATA
jgi:hypothetical protein